MSLNWLKFIFSGVKVLEGVAVQNIETKDNAVSRVTTDKGTIDCEIFVNCAGQVCSNCSFKSNMF
jgi:glycine/D-amino acid oxidase-like deaminating enzyme